MHSPSLLRRTAQKGNAIIFVLMGVALFGALAFIVSRGAKTGGNVTEEKAFIIAQEIGSYATKVAGAVDLILLNNGCLQDGVSFANDSVGGYANGTNDACKVFNAAGGGMSFATPPTAAVDTAAATDAGSSLAGDYFFSGNIVVDNAGSSSGDLVMVMPWVTEAVCKALNQILRNDPEIPADASTSFDGTKFQGTYAEDFTLNPGTDMLSGCYAGSGGYHFYHVLLAR